MTAPGILVGLDQVRYMGWGLVSDYEKTHDRDDTASFARAAERHVVVTVPYRSRRYHWRGESRTDRGEWYGVPVPSHRTITRLAGGPKPRIFLELPDPATVVRATDDWLDPNNVAHLRIEQGAEHVTIDGLAFEGQASRLTEKRWIVNVQATAIRDVNGRYTAVRNCAFAGLYGFAYHQPGGGFGLTYTNNSHRDCMNGVNPNCDDLFTEKNTFLRSEGIEASGSDQRHVANDFEQVIIAYSLGGHMGTGEMALQRNVRIAGGTIDGTLWLDQQEGPPSAIAIADNLEDVLVEGVAIMRAAGNGIHAHTSSVDRPVRRIRLLRNTLESIGVKALRGRPNEWSRYAIFLEHVEGAETFGNVIGETDPAYGARAGVFARECRGDLVLGPDTITVEGEPYATVGCERVTRRAA